MQKIGNITPTADANGEWTNGNVAAGTPPTIMDAGWFNTIQRELVNIVTAGGLALDPQNDAQVIAALKILFLQAGNNLSEIKQAGTTAQQAAIANLGLGSGSALPVGVPVPYPLSTPPSGWLKCNGASFSGVAYPALALAYPGLTLPDLRGEFIRGWDDGRGVDSGRGILTAQSQNLQPFSLGIKYSVTNINGGGTPINAIDGNGSNTAQTLTFQGSETRPRNIAFCYIVRAA